MINSQTYNKYIRIVTASVVTIWFVALTVYYLTAYQYHFYWQEQNQIFMYSAEYLRSYFDRPAWLACIAGDYLTQFYYYRFAGPAILIVALMVTVIALYSAIRRLMPKWLAAIVLIASAIWLSLCTFGADYRLSSLICVTGALISYLILKPAKSVGPLLLPLVFLMFGYGWIITAALLLIATINRRSKWMIATYATGTAAVLLMAGTLYSMPYTRVLAYPGAGIPQASERLFEQTLAVDNEYYFGNLNKSIALAKATKEPNEITSFYYYLSCARKNSLPDSLLHYPVKDLGTLQNIGEGTPLPVIGMMNELYYQLGDMTYTERAAMMGNVFSPQNRNVRMVKRLAEANMVSGDTAAANKYLRILAKTHAYRRWAENRMQSDMPNDIRHDIERRQKSVNRCDTLRIGDNCRTILTELLESNPDNILALDYLLCTDLLLKDMDSFKQDYDRYCIGRGKPRIKPLYQQALMIYLAGTGADTPEWEKYIQMPDEMQRFDDYNRHRGSEEYADTYWYYFDTHK